MKIVYFVEITSFQVEYKSEKGKLITKINDEHADSCGVEF